MGRRDRGNKDVCLGVWVALSYDPFRIEVGEGEGEREKAGGNREEACLWMRE